MPSHVKTRRLAIRRSILTITLLLCRGEYGHAQPRVEARLRLEVGALGNDTAVVFGSIVGATRLSDGLIAVADGAGSQVVLLSEGGRVARRFGRRGQGPGEFLAIAWMGQCERDQLFVLDFQGQRVSVLDRTGSLLRTFQFPVMAPSCSRRGVLAGLGAPSVERGGDRFAVARAPLILFDTLGRERRRLQTVDAYDAVWFGEVPMLRPLGKSASLVVMSDRVAVGTGSTPVVQRTLSGETLPDIRMERTSRAPQPSNLERSVEDQLVLAPEGRPKERLRERLKSIGLPSEAPDYFDLFSDGRLLWAQVSMPGETVARFALHTLEGRSVGQVVLEGALRVLEVGPDYVLARGVGEQGEHVLRLYTVSRRGAAR